MQSTQMDRSDEVTLMKFLNKIHVHEAQLNLLQETMNNNTLLSSKILSSIQPKVGKEFLNIEVENQKQRILLNTRKQLIKLAIKDKEKNLQQLNSSFNEKKEEMITNFENPNKLLEKLEQISNNQCRDINEKMNKKVEFHLQGQHEKIKFTKAKVYIKKRSRKPNARQKKKKKATYIAKKKEKTQLKIKAIVNKVKDENIVVNLSNEEVPDAAYVFLQKGLGFVPAYKVDMEDLKYDTMEFVRKLEWRAFFEANPELQTSNSKRTHEDIRVSSFTHPQFNHPLLDEIRTKLLGWIANHKPSKPKPNLTPLEMRGRKWLVEAVKAEKVFVTKADKGGATLIMNHTDVQEAIEKELFDQNKFTKLERNTDDQLVDVKHKLKSLAINLKRRKLISDDDKTLMTGLTENNHSKLAPEYQPESPYVYPLFKIHKLSRDDINNKKVPPNRLVHASKFSPLYRMEKWCSPHLTKISRAYCKEEFILDKRHLVEIFKDLNSSKKLQNENIHLFTLDVEQLYPNIKPQLASLALNEAFATDKTTDNKTKQALEELIKFSFDNAYVSYKEETFSSKIGIPTGGSLSRQIADIFLHWILFVKANPNIPSIEAIRLFKRFIDDCIGLWRGSRRSFDNFVNVLNREAAKFGIKFPVKEIQFGKSVDFLDLTVYLDEDNNIHYKGYTKPTDARRYLNTKSFHPRSVFTSIPYSQMLRTVENNSKEETRVTQLTELIGHFQNSGYSKEELMRLKEKALAKISESTSQPTRETPTDETIINSEDRTLVFPLYFFEGIEEFKGLIHGLKGNSLATQGSCSP